MIDGRVFVDWLTGAERRAWMDAVIGAMMWCVVRIKERERARASRRGYFSCGVWIESGGFVGLSDEDVVDEGRFFCWLSRKRELLAEMLGLVVWYKAAASMAGIYE